jgi:RNA polymerase sigma factor (TIGR02999 family)
MATSAGDTKGEDGAAPAADDPMAPLFERADAGDARAKEQIFAALYQRLHRLARREVARRGGMLTLGATTLLHEVFLDMSGREGTRFPDQVRFLAYASRAMRGVVIDHVRGRQAEKRGGLLHITALDTATAESVADRVDLLPIHDALEELEQVEPALAQIVDLRFFCGFSVAEIAALQNVSERTVSRQWEKARTLLHRALRADP